jgi:hypothetical protein
MPTLNTAPLPTFTSTSDNLFVQSTGNITYNDSIKSLSLPTIIKAPQLSLNFPNPFFGPANRYISADLQSSNMALLIAPVARRVSMAFSRPSILANSQRRRKFGQTAIQHLKGSIFPRYSLNFPKIPAIGILDFFNDDQWTIGAPSQTKRSLLLVQEQ